MLEENRHEEDAHVGFRHGGRRLAALLAASWTDTSAGQGTADAVRVDQDDVGGVVTGPKGPEAGVWVIAETTDLPTKFARIVVTDDRGRYLLPDLPKANYAVWVRGYGLVDSPKSQTVAREDREPDGGAPRPTRAPRRSTIPPASGFRCSASLTRANSPARAPPETASRKT